MVDECGKDKTTETTKLSDNDAILGNRAVLQDSVKSESYAGNAFFGKYWKIKLEMTNYAKNFRC